MNNFELKSSITKNFKNSVNELSIRMEREEERNTELEGRTIEINQSKQQKENNRLWEKKNEQKTGLGICRAKQNIQDSWP